MALPYGASGICFVISFQSSSAKIYVADGLTGGEKLSSLVNFGKYIALINLTQVYKPLFY